MITWPDFEKVEMRIGTIIDVQDFAEARNPAYKLLIDFGEYGIKRSSAQISKLYTKENLLHRQIIAVINFAPKQIAHFFSECLVLGVIPQNEAIVLLQPDQGVANGSRIG